jgi:hypothetical protein
MSLDLIPSRLPKGFAWNIAQGSQLDDVLNSQEVEEEVLLWLLERAGDCGTVRDPYKAIDYNMLSKELGVAPYDEIQSLGDFRKYLASFYYSEYRTGSDTDLQKVLNDAGFTDAVVIKNNQQQNPKLFMNLVPQMVAGQDDAVAGHVNAYAGEYGYEVLVNGPLYDNLQRPITYPIGDYKDLWGYVDFIGSDVTYDGNGNIVSITPLQIFTNEERSFKRLILRTKPVHNWIVLVVEYIEPNVIAQTGDPNDNTYAQTGDPNDMVIAQA